MECCLGVALLPRAVLPLSPRSLQQDAILLESSSDMRNVRPRPSSCLTCPDYCFVHVKEIPYTHASLVSLVLCLNSSQFLASLESFMESRVLKTLWEGLSGTVQAVTSKMLGATVFVDKHANWQGKIKSGTYSSQCIFLMMEANLPKQNQAVFIILSTWPKLWHDCISLLEGPHTWNMV